MQYRLVKTQPFDRATIGEIKLTLEKDREGWLPQSTTFSIGGGEKAFVFERSAGTVEEGPGTFVIKSRERIALEILVHQFGLEGARYSAWLKACRSKEV